MTRRDWTPPVWSVLLVLTVAVVATPRACDHQMAFYDAVVPVQVQR